MRQSQLFTKTKKELPKDEVSKNAQLLIQAGFVHKEMAGVYTYLPLGKRVLENIMNIIREELNAINCQEVSMTALQPKELWEQTDRWSDEVVDNWFKTTLKGGHELGLGFTHEEPMTNMMKSFISSYKDMPGLVYQFQTKFRNELRAKSGIMRGREFLMKDLYSFHSSKEEHLEFYEKMKEVYMRIFTRLGIGDRTFITMSSGQPFSKYSYEFQTLSEAGEDIIYVDKAQGVAINKDDFSEETLADFGLKKEDLQLEECKSIEVGDIYTLGTRYSDAIGLKFTDEDGEVKPVFMGSYGIGIPRVMGTIVEIHNDERGICWPKEVAPFAIHLISLCNDEQKEKAEKLYATLLERGVEVLYDDRADVRAGQKFADADLYGIPYRVVISSKTLAEESIELKERTSEQAELVKIEEFLKKIS